MTERESWLLRPIVTATIGAAGALLVQQLANGDQVRGDLIVATWRIALACAVGVAAIVAIFTLERRRAAWAAGFALAAGLVAGLVTWWNGSVQPGGAWFVDWWTACLALSVAIAATLFQTVRDAGSARFDYAEVHGNAWTNVMLLGASVAFTGIAFFTMFLLASLFRLIGIRILSDLMEYGWWNAMIAGAAFGAAVGLFRERDRVVRTLQRLAMAVLSILAPVLGAGLLLFLIALPFTGLTALWDATKATTPILLTCVIAALLLVNAVIGDGEGEEAPNPALRWGAVALGLAMLPLGVIAAVATGLRIGQHGITPDRLWAVTFIAVACAYALAYLVALVRRRQGWAAEVRRANLRLAFGMMGLALLLATPLIGFNAISTRDQVTRLQSGRVTPERFDWSALAYDFGAPGRAALARLAKGGGTAATLARTALANTNRWELRDLTEQAARRAAVMQTVRVLPQAVPLPPGLVALLPGWDACGDTSNRGCVVLYRPGANEAVMVAGGCVAQPGSERHVTVCAVRRLALAGGKWRVVEPYQAAPTSDEATTAALREAAAQGAVEVRDVTRRQVFIGGRAVGDVFE
ncbi:DUF4153 domain-containing protein [Sphingomonas sp. RS2018]